MVRDVSREEVQRLVAEGAQLADVRPEAEYGQEHITGAINLPLKSLDATAASNALERDKPIVVY